MVRSVPRVELALHGSACLHEADVEHAQSHAAQRRRHVARRDALRKTLHHGGLADAGFAGQDRVVLTPPHQHVDDLADLVVTAKNRIHVARFRLGGEILGKAIESRGALRSGGLNGARRSGRDKPRSIHRTQVFLVRRSPDLAVLGGQNIDRYLAEFLRDIGEGAREFARLQCADQDVAGANLGFAKKQGGVVPAAVEHIHHGVGDRRHLGFILAETAHHRGDIGHQLAPIELEVVGRKGDVGAIAL